jgi:hypothetical protein
MQVHEIKEGPVRFRQRQLPCSLCKQQRASCMSVTIDKGAASELSEQQGRIMHEVEDVSVAGT